MIDMTTQDRTKKFALFILGIALPVAGVLLWSKSFGCKGSVRREEIDQAHDITVEDSFPASDPPSAW
jgi:hypothetical protein